MSRPRAFLPSVLVLLLLAFSFNAYACLVPLFGAAGMMRSGCMDPGEESARQFCDTFKTLGMQSLPDLQPASDSLAFCPGDTTSLVLLLSVPAPGIPASGHVGESPPRDLLVKSSVLRL